MQFAYGCQEIKRCTEKRAIWRKPNRRAQKQRKRCSSAHFVARLHGRAQLFVFPSRFSSFHFS